LIAALRQQMTLHMKEATNRRPGLAPHQFHQSRLQPTTTNAIEIKQKRSKINEADRYPPAYSVLVAGTSSVRTNNENQ
jgi:hypothetical protein